MNKQDLVQGEYFNLYCSVILSSMISLYFVLSYVHNEVEKKAISMSGLSDENIHP